MALLQCEDPQLTQSFQRITSLVGSSSNAGDNNW